MHHGVEDVEILISFLKRMNILLKHLLCDFSVGTPARCRGAVTKLNDCFIERFLSFSLGDVIVVVCDFTIGTLLFLIVLRDCPTEQLIKRIPDIFTHISHVQMGTFLIDILCNELPVTVRDVGLMHHAALAQRKTDAEFLHHSLLLFFKNVPIPLKSVFS